jgi:proprotein convertase subtilisin/kexin type 2
MYGGSGEASMASAGNILTNSFLVQFHADTARPLADQIAHRNGFINRGPVTGSKQHYHFVHTRSPHVRTRRDTSIHHSFMSRESLVKNIQQQHGYLRHKRGLRSVGDLTKQFPDYKTPNDPYFKNQWYLRNTGQANGKARLDLNVEEAWAIGFTGKNITTAIMDDGVDYTHPDLMNNFNFEASYDFSSNDPFPYPRYTDDWFNSHGTRCAGEIAAARDNNICGVGVAYDSKVAGIRMLDQPYMTDLIEANSMSHEPNMIDIYSASWGPTDDGKTVDGPRHTTMKAIVQGINEGRQGRGSIYVWASGDGGDNDDCNCDGYAASMWTISINSAINDGRTALYDESCSSTLASTFSNGRSNDPEAGVATTDLYGECTLKHSGTSAAAPEAAGVFALALEANPNLTWRDLQYLTVLTAKRNQLYDPSNKHLWNINGAGLEFNHLFGYGVLDAGEMVRTAQNWKPLPTRSHCEAGSVKGTQKIPTNGNLTITIDTDACMGENNAVNYLEHVQAFITLKSSRRGNTVIYITSPLGTRSLLLSRRPLDTDSERGFQKWPFMTTHAWSEHTRGTWKLEIMFDMSENEDRGATETTGEFFEWILLLHGTNEAPYTQQTPLNENTKLAVAKNIHANDFKDNERFVNVLKQDHQKRLGDDVGM